MEIGPGHLGLVFSSSYLALYYYNLHWYLSKFFSWIIRFQSFKSEWNESNAILLLKKTGEGKCIFLPWFYSFCSREQMTGSFIIHQCSNYKELQKCHKNVFLLHIVETCDRIKILAHNLFKTPLLIEFEKLSWIFFLHFSKYLIETHKKNGNFKKNSRNWRVQ